MDPYAAQTYPPPPSSSQTQPPTQDPYIYNQQYNQPQHYQYYPQIPPQPQSQPQQPPPSQHYPNAVYQQHPEQDPAAIHPPGVQIPADPSQIPAYQYGYAQTHLQNDPNSYYPQHQQVVYSDPGVVQQGQQQQPPPPWQQPVHTGDYGHASIYPPNGQAQYGGPGSAGSGRGGGRPFRGGGSSAARGRGRGRGRGGGGKPSLGQPPKAAPCMAWCELCRVDCNTLEILENHKNGKKHKKNLKIQEDLQKLAAKSHEAAQMAAAGNVGNPPETAAEGGDPANGPKRKTTEGGGKPTAAEPSKKPKEIIPFICELCNVKCESAPTFDSHLKGKKHAFNLQVFQEQQATLGQAALQALYPALLQALAFPANGGLDQQVLQWLQPFLPRTGPAVLPPPGPEPAQGGPTEKVDGPGPEPKAADQVAEEPDTKAAELTEPTK